MSSCKKEKALGIRGYTRSRGRRWHTTCAQGGLKAVRPASLMDFFNAQIIITSICVTQPYDGIAQPRLGHIHMHTCRAQVVHVMWIEPHIPPFLFLCPGELSLWLPAYCMSTYMGSMHPNSHDQKASSITHIEVASWSAENKTAEPRGHRSIARAWNPASAHVNHAIPAAEPGLISRSPRLNDFKLGEGGLVAT